MDLKSRKPLGYGHVLSVAALVGDSERFNRSMVSRFFSREELKGSPYEEMEELRFEDYFAADKPGEVE